MSVSQERSKDLYEEMPGYQKPPLIPLPDPDDTESLEWDLEGTKTHSIRFKILKSVLLALGFKKFQQRLTENGLENLLRRTNLRRLGQSPLTISATVNLLDDPRKISAIERAATLLLASRQLHTEIRSGIFAPDKYRGQHLEMGQYPNLFATSTIWGRGRKQQIFKSTDMSHFNLVIGRRFYSLEVGEEESELSINSLLETLHEVVEQAKRNPLGPDEPSLGLLSSAKTTTQRKAFRILQKGEKNRETYQALRHSVLTICLDLDHMPASDAEAAHIAQSENLCNRWHQSSLQMVVFGNAKACTIFRFDACLDGNTMMRGAAEIQKRAAIMGIPSQKSPFESNFPSAHELGYTMQKTHAQKAWTDVRTILDNQQSTFEIKNIGSHFFRHHKVDAVPAFVLALHMATWHFTGKSARIEQLLSMSKYRCMGLSTVMVTNPEMTRFTEYMQSSDIQNEKARALLLAAIETQTQDCRTARSDLPFSQLIPLFLNSLQGWQRIIKIVFAATHLLLGIKWSSDVILSHPAIFPETPMVGRPGVRLPYVSYFGLHYRLMDESIMLTMMPSLDWKISNAEFISLLEKKLNQVADVISS